jgi:CheY-like chemotaxis protein
VSREGGLNLVHGSSGGSLFQMRSWLATRACPGPREFRRSLYVRPSRPHYQPVTAELGGVDVLVVEDHVDTRELLRMWLEAAGANVREASGGEQALQQVRHSPPDVILCDLRLPGMDGCAFVKQMHGDLIRRIPVVALTADAAQEATVRTLEAGFNAHLVKPVAREVVVAQIARALGRKISGQ